MSYSGITIAAAISIAALGFYSSARTPDQTREYSVTSDSTLASPISQTTPEMLDRGRLQFNIACSPCHDADGTGDGPLAANLRAKPRDLTRGIYMNRSTASGQLPTDDDIYHTITTGLHNTAMPSFRAMAIQDRWAVVAFVKTLSPRFQDSTEYPLDVLNMGDQLMPTAEGLARGRKIYLQMQCASCHGTYGEGDGIAAGTHLDDFGRRVWPTNLTNPSDYKFSRSVRDVYRIFSTGLNGTPMPSYAQTLSDTDRWLLANYVWEQR